MNKRKFKRAVGSKSKDDLIFTRTAEKYINYAINGHNRIENIGNFIFLSAISGEAWLLDHRENLALRLADHYEALPYTITENATQFAVEWTEKFYINEETFVACTSEKEIIFMGYPISELQDLINQIKKNL